MSGRVITSNQLSSLPNLRVLDAPVHVTAPAGKDPELELFEISETLKIIKSETAKMSAGLGNMQSMPGDLKALGNLCQGLTIQLREALALVQLQSSASQKLLDYMVNQNKNATYESVPVKGAGGQLLKWVTTKKVGG